jgi:hypothetical protein
MEHAFHACFSFVLSFRLSSTRAFLSLAAGATYFTSAGLLYYERSKGCACAALDGIGPPTITSFPANELSTGLEPDSNLSIPFHPTVALLYNQLAA